MSIFTLAILLWLLPPPAADARQLVNVTFESTEENFPNPERGFYSYTEYRPGSSPLTLSQLQAVRSQERSLISRSYTMSGFTEADISDNWLNVMAQDFETMRQAGVKSVLRFRYSTRIGDPDASLEIVKRHVEQLKPVLEDNFDVIAVMEAGFIGAWGEWHSSTNNLTTTENMREVLYSILDALPDERTVLVRTPRYKMNIFGRTAPLSEEEAFDKSRIARTGHHNDGFLASSTDLGTYMNTTFEKNYLVDETRFVPIGGETGGVSSGEYYRCENAVPEMERLRWSYLNSGWYGPTLQTWRDEGCMPEVERRLGYRFVLTEGRFSEEVRPGGSLRFELDVMNEGFASPYNRRRLQAVIRSLDNPEMVYEVDLPEDPRFWLGGESQSLAFDLGIPSDFSDGLYELFLYMPDPVEALRKRPEYAIRLANEGVWEEATGYNRLQHLVVVDSGAEGDEYEGNLWFVPEGTSTSRASDAMELPGSIRLHQNYPNPFNPTTTIRFDLHEAMAVRLDVFNAIGQKVKTLIDGHRSAGEHQVSFNANRLSGGLYLYKLTTSNADSQSRAMTILK